MKKIFVLLSIFLYVFAAFVSCMGTIEEDEKESYKDIDSEVEVIETEISETIYDASSEIIEIKSFDGYMLKGKLTLPQGAKDVSKLVIFVNGSGANTYDNHRNTGEMGFNYFDFYADEFSKLGTAFFSYNTRGVDIGDTPPMYNDIDEEEYKTYLPLNSVEDVYYMINALKENERLKNCEVYLLGWSEGTIIAPLVAEKYPDSVDGLLLAGYVNENMKDILIWQNTGGSSYAWFRGNFDTDEQGRISKESFNADPNGMIATELQNTPFKVFDIDNDGYIDEKDCFNRVTAIMGEFHGNMLNAIEKQDDTWLKINYGSGIIPLTSAWFLEHFSLRSNMEVLPTLDLPIYIFHGTVDLNCDVNGVYKIKEEFDRLNKNNLKINIFENHNHDLNYMDIINKNEIPTGIQAILDAVANMK